MDSHHTPYGLFSFGAVFYVRHVLIYLKVLMGFVALCGDGVIS